MKKWHAGGWILRFRISPEKGPFKNKLFFQVSCFRGYAKLRGLMFHGFLVEGEGCALFEWYNFLRCDFFRAFFIYKKKTGLNLNHYFIKGSVFLLFPTFDADFLLTFEVVRFIGCQVTWRWLQNYIQQQPQLKGFLPAASPTGVPKTFVFGGLPTL